MVMKWLKNYFKKISHFFKSSYLKSYWISPKDELFSLSYNQIHRDWIYQNLDLLKRKYEFDIHEFLQYTGTEEEFLIKKGWLRITYIFSTPKTLTVEAYDISNVRQSNKLLYLIDSLMPENIIIYTYSDNKERSFSIQDFLEKGIYIFSSKNKWLE